MPTKPRTSTYVQGVEAAADYEGPVPEGFDVIRLPAADYLMFQGEPFREETTARPSPPSGRPWTAMILRSLAGVGPVQPPHPA